ncbi:HD-GYP domain-containing protein [Carboxydocella sp. ULO1]|uniref:HD-GYP domain-containing protein n=1 Tax=Carboxydocella sp. ULO1 TaxID=1926599 RepID=UPI0009C7A1C6|nr:HD-GYP domain-containing protein [Carboxydocella sp. ULO1]GAW29341.1 HDIG domain-containing protein [Carboxydocella sp. ULO1]
MFEPVWQWLKTRNKRFWAMSMAWLRWLGYGEFLYLTAMDKSEGWWQLALLGWLVLLGLQYLRYLRAPLHGPMMWMVFLGELGYLVWLTAHHSGQAGALIIFYYLHLLTILLAYEQLEAALMFMVHQGVVLIAYYTGWISGEFLARYLLGLLFVAGANFWQWDKIIRERQFWTAKRNYQRLALRLADHSTRLLQHQLTENEYKDLLQEMLELLCGLPGGAVFRRQEQGTWELYLAFGVAVRGQQELLPLPRGLRTIRIEHIPYLLGELQELPVKFKGKKEKYAFAPLVNINQVPETLAPETGWRLARVIELWQQGPVLKAANRAYITGIAGPGKAGAPIRIERELELALPRMVLRFLTAATGARQAFIIARNQVTVAVDEEHELPIICLDQTLEALLLLAQSREEGLLVNNLAVLGLWSREQEGSLHNIMVYPLLSNHEVQGYLVLQNKWGDHPFTEEEWQLGGTMARSLGLNLGIKNFVASLLQKQDDAYRLLASACQAYVSFLGGHLHRTADLAEKMALALGLPADQARKIWRAGLIHDIGMLAIERQLLTKPGPLSFLEKNLVQDHVKYARKILQGQKMVDKEILEMVEQHHERWDGRGYPAGLKGDEISLGARILAVAEAFDAILNFRHYQPPRSLVEALEELMREAGQQFDPLLVDVLIIIIINEEQHKGNDLMRDLRWVQELAQEAAVAASWLSGGDRDGSQGMDFSGQDNRSGNSPGGSGTGSAPGGTGSAGAGSE